VERRKKKKQAYQCFLSSANREHVRAMYNLAMMLEKGDGIEQNLSEAIRWYKKAADKGDVRAQEKYQKFAALAANSGPIYNLESHPINS